MYHFTKRKESLCLFFLAGLLILLAGFCFFSWEKLTRIVNSFDDKKLPPLIIACDEFDPYFYRNEKGDYAGVDVELMTEVCRRLGYAPVFRLINWETKDALLSSGQIDCLTGAFSMNGREDRYLWAGPHMNSRQVVMVPEESPIQSLSDLNGKRVAVQNSGKAEEYLISSDPTHPKVRDVLSFSTIEEAIFAMRKGYVDAVAGHEGPLVKYTEMDGESYRVLKEPLSISHIGVAFKKGGDAVLAASVQETLKDIEAEGTTAKIVAKYGLDPALALGKEGDK